MNKSAQAHSLEEDTLVVDLDAELSIFALLLGLHDAAELLVHHVEAVADAQHGDVDAEYVGIVLRRVLGVHRAGAARDDDGSDNGE